MLAGKSEGWVSGRPGVKLQIEPDTLPSSA
jgi:hypothetical protein